MLWGLYTLGFDWEANDFFYFVADNVRRAADGHPDHVRDRRREGARPRTSSTTCRATRARGRCGSATAPATSSQHDVWGAVLDSVYLHTQVARHAARARLADARAAGRARRSSNWQKPDRGIWEVRGEPKHFTSSKLMCWVALDRGARLAQLRDDDELAEQWQRDRATRSTTTSARTRVDERGVFTQHYDTDALDASVLLMPLVALPAADRPRASATRCWRSPTS